MMKLIYLYILLFCLPLVAMEEKSMVRVEPLLQLVPFKDDHATALFNNVYSKKTLLHMFPHVESAQDLAIQIIQNSSNNKIQFWTMKIQPFSTTIGLCWAHTFNQDGSIGLGSGIDPKYSLYLVPALVLLKNYIFKSSPIKTVITFVNFEKAIECITQGFKTVQPVQQTLSINSRQVTLHGVVMKCTKEDTDNHST